MAVVLIQVHKPNSCIGLQQSLPICQALEDFCGLRSQISDQHYDLRAATTVRDEKHEFSKHLISLFDRGAMRKTDKVF